MHPRRHPHAPSRTPTHPHALQVGDKKRSERLLGVGAHRLLVLATKKRSLLSLGSSLGSSSKLRVCFWRGLLSNPHPNPHPHSNSNLHPNCHPEPHPNPNPHPNLKPNLNPNLNPDP